MSTDSNVELLFGTGDTVVVRHPTGGVLPTDTFRVLSLPHEVREGLVDRFVRVVPTMDPTPMRPWIAWALEHPLCFEPGSLALAPGTTSRHAPCTSAT